MLDNDNLSEQLSLMKKKRDEIYDEIQMLQRTHHSIDSRINNIEKEMEVLSNNTINDFSIEIKQIPKRRVLYLRRQSERVNLTEYTLFFNDLVEIAKKNNIIPSSPLMLIHHHIDLSIPFEELEMEKSIKDVEVCFPTSSDFSDPAFVRFLPEGLYLSMIRKGMSGKEVFKEVYTYIYAWLKENSYQATGPIMDILLSDITNLQPDYIMNNVITEIQVPIKKIH